MATRQEWKRYYIQHAAGLLDAGDAFADANVEEGDLTDAEADRAQAGKELAVEAIYRVVRKGALANRDGSVDARRA